MPLDSFTIVGLRRIAPQFGIKATATMKDIQTLGQYVAFQREIASIASAADVPPIYCDILAWDVSHPLRPGSCCQAGRNE